jgi:PAS domain S-box-containing protein
MKNLQAYIRKGKFYEAVVEQGSDIIFIVDFSGTIHYHNAAVRSLGYRSGSLVGKSLFDYILPGTREVFQKQFKQSLRKAYNQKIEFQFRCRDNTYRFFEFNSINLKHRGGPEGLILDCRDITQRKEDAAELLRLQKAKEQFMANISHDIRTPINGIAGMVELLMQNLTEAERSTYLNAIRHSAESLKVIINDLLDLSAIQSGKFRFEAIPFNPAELIQNLAQTFFYQIREKRLAFNLNIHPDVNRMIMGDPARLNQILSNLLSNAVKFTHRGAITLTATAAKLKGNKFALQVSVKDTGIGIPADKLTTIFESFTQADASVTRRYGGTGLGLAIARQLTELQGGTIAVQSKEFTGSEFTVNIPYKSAAPGTKSQDSPVTEKPPAGLRVLLVEDNEVNRMYTEALLKSWQCMTETAENGIMAVEKMKSQSFDVVLMDVQMPVMDGYESTQAIRRLPGRMGTTPVVALTANATQADLEKCFAAGMNAFLPKPFTRNDLYRVLFTELKLTPTKATPAPEAFDLTYLRQVADGNVDFMRDIIHTFIQSASSICQRTETLLLTDNWKEIGRLIHQIKPSLTLIGMPLMKEKATTLEESCRTLSTPPETLRHEIKAFIQQLELAIASLRAAAL